MDKNSKKDVWGYSAKSVHKVIQKIQAVHDKEIEALREELLKFKKENEELAQKRSEGGSIVYTPMSSTFWGDIEKYLGPNHGIINTEPKDSIPIATVKPTSSPQNHSTKTDVINAEVQSIRNRYIVVRLAGEALYGNDGQLIIQKYNTITETVVEIADREGKLADLIVNMIIPKEMIKNKKGEEDA